MIWFRRWILIAVSYTHLVKVIIMYPMNALASDQAKRLAETIWGDERLRGKVTAGLFVGVAISLPSC